MSLRRYYEVLPVAPSFPVSSPIPLKAKELHPPMMVGTLPYFVRVARVSKRKKNIIQKAHAGDSRASSNP